MRDTVASAALHSGTDQGASLLQWAELGRKMGFTDFMSPEDAFRTCLATARPWRNRYAPGIYFWHAEDGEAYVGQSINPQSRLREHWRTHRDIVRACFLACSRGELNHREAQLIEEAGRHFNLRNVKLAVTTAREVPFDKAVGDQDREAFVEGETLQDVPWRTFPLLEQLQRRRFEKFLQSEGSAVALATLQTFVSRVIPRPAATEVGFWSATIFPNRGFLRLNAGQQEIFTYDCGAVGSEVRAFTDRRLSLLGYRRSRYQVESYEATLPAERFATWLCGPRLLACRRLAVRLMRHTVAMNSGSHCPHALRHKTSA
jgi:hypothetical protein